MPVRKLQDFLDNEGVKYVRISHSPAYTAQEIAAKAHIPGRELAKTVVVKISGKMALAVMPASLLVDFDLLREATGAEDAVLATEEEFKSLFPGCELGAMPPFGNLFNMDVFVTEALTQDEEIAFNAGSHTELIRMKYSDFERLVRPKITRLAMTP